MLPSPPTLRSLACRGGTLYSRQKAFALQSFAGKLACPAYGFGFLASFPFGGFFVMAPQLHFAEDALSLHLFLESFQSLIDIIVADDDLHD